MSGFRALFAKPVLRILAAGLLIGSQMAAAQNVWIHDVKIAKFGTYQHSTLHFVWLSSGTVPACQQQSPSNPTLHFDEASPGGKTLVSVMTAAVIAKANVDVQVSGCQIIEVYLK